MRECPQNIRSVRGALVSMKRCGGEVWRQKSERREQCALSLEKHMVMFYGAFETRLMVSSERVQETMPWQSSEV